MKYFRDCPRCSSPISYSTKGDMKQGEKHNTNCKKCVADLRIYGKNPKQYSRKCPKCSSEIKVSSLKYYRICENQNKLCRSCASPHKGKNNIKLIDTFKAKYIREEKICKTCSNLFFVNNWDKNKKYCGFDCYINDDVIVKGKFFPSFNMEACNYFSELNRALGWSGQHAMDGGEKKIMKYWVDYYEPNLNLIIEWDEEHHSYQMEKDIIRQKEIIDKTNCLFYRINPKKQTISKINKDGNTITEKKDYWDFTYFLPTDKGIL